MYRGARTGDPKQLTGPSFFISNELFAKTYGPIAAFKLDIQNPKVVDDEEWGRFDSVAGDPEAVSELAAQGYDSTINVPKTSIGPLYVVVLVDPEKATLVDKD